MQIQIQITNNRNFLYFLATLLFLVSCNKKKNTSNSYSYSKKDSIQLGKKQFKGIKIYKAKNVTDSLLINKNKQIANITLTRLIYSGSNKVFIMESVNEDNKNVVENWFDNDYNLMFKEINYFSINEIFYSDINIDGNQELLRIQGYEDGVHYSISEFFDEKLIKKFYFIPVCEFLDSNKNEKYFFASSDNIKRLATENNKLKVSYDNLALDYKLEKTPNQTIVPILIFRVRKNVKIEDVEHIKELKQIKYVSYKELLDNILDNESNCTD